MDKKHLKPIYWGLFAGGGTLAALILPALIVLFGVLLPFGLIGFPPTLHTHWQGFVSRWWVFIPLALILFMLLWHTVHRLYYILHDMHIHVGNKTRWSLYAFALLILVLTLVCGLY